MDNSLQGWSSENPNGEDNHDFEEIPKQDPLHPTELVPIKEVEEKSSDHSSRDSKHNNTTKTTTSPTTENENIDDYNTTTNTINVNNTDGDKNDAPLHASTGQSTEIASSYTIYPDEETERMLTSNVPTDETKTTLSTTVNETENEEHDVEITVHAVEDGEGDQDEISESHQNQDEISGLHQNQVEISGLQGENTRRRRVSKGQRDSLESFPDMDLSADDGKENEEGEGTSNTSPNTSKRMLHKSDLEEIRQRGLRVATSLLSSLATKADHLVEALHLHAGCNNPAALEAAIMRRMELQRQAQLEMQAMKTRESQERRFSISSETSRKFSVSSEDGKYGQESRRSSVSSPVVQFEDISVSISRGLDFPYDTALHKAAMLGHIAIVDLLLIYGADVQKANTIGVTPLHYAAEFGHLKVAELLMMNDADVNATTDNGDTPLHLAAYGGHHEVTELITQFGGNLEAKRPQDGATPVLAAARYGQIPVARVLIEKGADVTVRDSAGSSTARVAFSQQHFATSHFLKAELKKAAHSARRADRARIKAEELEMECQNLEWKEQSNLTVRRLRRRLPRESLNLAVQQPPPGASGRQLAEFRLAQLAFTQRTVSNVVKMSYSNVVEATRGFEETFRLTNPGPEDIFGHGYECILHGRRVIVRRMTDNSLQGLPDLQEDFMAKIVEVSHPNLVRVLGSAVEMGLPPCLIYEYFPHNRNLSEALKGYHALLVSSVNSDGGNQDDRGMDLPAGATGQSPVAKSHKTLTWKERVQVAVQVARALSYLHLDCQLSFLHGAALHPEQILIHRQISTCHVSDDTRRERHVIAKLAVVAPWTVLPPSTLQVDPPTTPDEVYCDPAQIAHRKSDPGVNKISVSAPVYSFGVILLEMLLGRKPEVGELANLRKNGSKGFLSADPYAGVWPEVIWRGMADLAKRCVFLNEKTRPNLQTELLPFLESSLDLANTYQEGASDMPSSAKCVSCEEHASFYLLPCQHLCLCTDHVLQVVAIWNSCPVCGDSIEDYASVNKSMQTRKT